MVIAWIGYCLLVSALLGLAAFASERALGHFRKPVRWAWFAAIGGSLTAPLVAFLAPGLFPGATPSPLLSVAGLGERVAAGPGPSAPAPAAEIGSAGGPDIGVLSAVPGWAWALLTLGMVVHLARAYRRLRTEMRTWTPGELHGSRVLLSEDRGPAVVGVGCSVVVMPRWIEDLEDRLLRLVFLHEREHQRAGDHRLFAVGIAALVLMPWNLFLWWQVSRLRLAIEFDCDRRVLARGESTRDYADALLAVGSRVSAPLLAAAAFAERKPSVERRLRRMTEPLARLRVPRTLGASGVAALAIILVLGAPRPEMSMDAPRASGPELNPPREAITWEEAESVEELEPPARGVPLDDRPVFLPFDTSPVLRNAGEVQRALQEAYPRDLRDAGVGGRVELWLYVDESGVVANHEVKTSSGSDALDRGAAEVAEAMRFEPARNLGEETAAWVSQWFTFQVLEGRGPPAAPRPLTINDIQVAGVVVSDIDQDGEADVLVRHGTPIIVVDGEIQGRAAGETPDPLIVVDGVIQSEGASLSDLQALDIEHVEVIKGDLALESYGEAGRNGVVHITTKKDE